MISNAIPSQTVGLRKGRKKSGMGREAATGTRFIPQLRNAFPATLEKMTSVVKRAVFAIRPETTPDIGGGGISREDAAIVLA